MRDHNPAISRGVIIAAIAFASILLAATAQAEKFGKISDEEWALGAPADQPDANAIIVFSNGVFDVDPDVITFERHVRMKVLNRAGIDEIGDWAFYFDQERDKVKDFHAHTITPDGQKHKVEKSAIFDKTVGDYVFRTFSFPAVDSGCILEFEYRVRSERFYWLNPWYFQDKLFTLTSRVSVKLAPGFSYNFDFSNVRGNDQEPKVDNLANPNMSGGQMQPIKQFTWTLSNLKGIKDEPYMSCVEDYRSSVRFQLTGYESPYARQSFVRSWEQVGEDVTKRFTEFCNASGDVKRLAQEITAGAATDEERSRALYDYVVETYGTVSELSTWYTSNEHLSDVLRELRGSPGEKNLLLAELHRALGIEAYPVMISTREHSKFSPRFPSIRWFDDLIVFVHLGEFWEFLDSRNKHVPYGLLPPNCLTDGGLLLDGAQSSLVKMSIIPVQSQRIDVTDMYVSNDGQVTCTTSSEFRGYMASSFGQRYDGTDPVDFMKRTYVDAIDAPAVLGTHTCSLDTTGCLKVNLNYSAEDLVRQLDNNQLVRPVAYAFHNNPFKSKNRYFPIDFTYPFSCVNIVRIFADESWTQPEFPVDTVMTAGGLRFERTSTTESNVHVITSTLIVERPDFTPGHYPAVRTFFEKVAAMLDEEVAFLVPPAE